MTDDQRLMIADYWPSTGGSPPAIARKNERVVCRCGDGRAVV
jgi:hypothetical protein